MPQATSNNDIASPLWRQRSRLCDIKVWVPQEVNIPIFSLQRHVGVLCNQRGELKVASADFAFLTKSICEGPEQYASRGVANDGNITGTVRAIELDCCAVLEKTAIGLP
jgi:hypothetical protein